MKTRPNQTHDHENKTYMFIQDIHSLKFLFNNFHTPLDRLMRLSSPWDSEGGTYDVSSRSWEDNIEMCVRDFLAHKSGTFLHVCVCMFWIVPFRLRLTYLIVFKHFFSRKMTSQLISGFFQHVLKLSLASFHVFNNFFFLCIVLFCVCVCHMVWHLWVGTRLKWVELLKDSLCCCMWHRWETLKCFPWKEAKGEKLRRMFLLLSTYRDSYTTIHRIMTILEVLFILFKIGRNERHQHDKDEEEKGELAHHDPSQQTCYRVRVR